jgi:hypothetical protein
MRRSPRSLALAALFGVSLLLLPDRGRSANAPAIPATRYYPLAVGNRWDYNYKRITSLTMVPVSGTNKSVTTTTEGVQTAEIVREDPERSGENGKVLVQKTTETTLPAADAGNAAPSPPRLVGESYFRVNDRGVWLISDGEPDDQGQSVQKITDRRLPLLWVPPDLKPGKSWVITCQIDPEITARITSVTGDAKTITVNGKSYENCLPIASVADHLEGRLDMGVGLAPIREGRLIDLTWYAPGIGVVRTHQCANFTLEPPNASFTEAQTHFEETQDLQPGYKATE